MPLACSLHPSQAPGGSLIQGRDSTMKINNNNRSGGGSWSEALVTKSFHTICTKPGEKFIVLSVMFAVFLSLNAQASAYEVKALVNAGSIRGKVHVGSAQPQVKRVSIFKNQSICGTEHRDIPLVQANGDGLLNTVVYLEDIFSGKPFRAASKKITINQLGCRFVPHLSVVTNGGEIEVINSDTILHNIHTYEMFGSTNFTSFSVSQPQRGDIVTKKIELKRGAGLRVMCDAHDFMRGFIFVARNPYYAVVDSDGEFFIQDVPPGTYKIKTWHGTLGEKEASVSIQPNGVVGIDIFY